MFLFSFLSARFELSTALVVPDPLLLGNTVGHSTGYVPSPTWSAHRFGSCILFSVEAEAVNQQTFFSAAMPLCVVSLSPRPPTQWAKKEDGKWE